MTDIPEPDARHLLPRYLAAGDRKYLTDSGWHVLKAHAEQQVHCYRSFVTSTRELSVGHDRLRVARVDFCRNTAQATSLGECLIGLYLDLVPISNLASQQKAFAEVLPSCGGGIPCYRSVPRLSGFLTQLTKQIRKAASRAVWLGRLPFDREQIDGAVAVLMAHLERWTRIDASVTQHRAAVPAMLPRYRIGLRPGQTACRRRKCLAPGGRWRQSRLVRHNHRQSGGAQGRAACGAPCFQS